MRALLVALLLVGGASAQWQMFQGDHLHQGTSAELVPAKQLWWTWSTPDDARVDAAPVTGGGVVLIADWAGRVTALDVESGRPLWSHKMAGAVVSTPAVALGWAYVADLTGKLVALDLQNGTVMATADVGPTRAPLTIKEAKVFVGNEQGEMQAYTATTLDLLWTYSVTEASETAVFDNKTKLTTCSPTAKHTARPIRTAAAVHDGMVVFGSMNHYLYAVDEHGEPDGTTTLQWRHRTNDIVLATPVIEPLGMRVFYATYGETVGSLPLRPSVVGAPCFGADVTPHWDFAVPGPADASKVHSTPAYDGQRLYFGTNHGAVYAVTAATGTEAWRLQTGGPVLASPVVGNGTVLVGSDDGQVRWLDAATGSVLASFQADGPIKIGAAVHDGTAIVVTEAGKVYRFGGDPPARADLTVHAITVEGSGIVITVRNVGAVASSPTRLDIIDNGSVAQSADIPSLPAGGETQVYYLPIGQTGLLVIEAIIDPDQALLEASKANNARSEALIVGDAGAQAVAPTPAGNAGLLGLAWWIWVVGAAVLMTGGGGGGYVWWRRRKAPSYEAEPEASVADRPLDASAEAAPSEGLDHISW